MDSCRTNIPDLKEKPEAAGAEVIEGAAGACAALSVTRAAM